MSGAEFVNIIQKYLNTNGEKPSAVSIIRSNPQQSKHLETARFTMDGISIDINNFREEAYTENSRIPLIKRCSAKEDAQRRDFTINAMFYNIRTKQIEDFCGGIQDLQDKLIRTPRDPMKTFRDDPLRVLRAARFAGRFNFKVADDIIIAASNKEIHKQLANKISRERIGMELHKILDKPLTSAKSLQYLADWGLRTTIFQVPPQFKATDEKELETLILKMQLNVPKIEQLEQDENKTITQQCIKAAKLADEYICSKPEVYSNHEDCSILFLSSFLHRYFGYQVDVPVSQKKGKQLGLVQFIIRDSLKLSTKLADSVDLTLYMAFRLLALSHSFTNDNDNNPDLILKSAHLLQNAGIKYFVVFDLARILNSRDSDPTQQLSQYINFLEKKTSLIKNKVWELKPIINGKELQAELQLSAGPSIGIYIKRLVEWQILHISENQAKTEAEIKKRAIQYLQEMTSPVLSISV